MDAFAARISTDLSSASQDQLSYFGGSGDDTVTAMTVADGKVWVAGGASADQPGAAAISTKDGYLAALDLTAGTAAVQRMTGKDGSATLSGPLPRASFSTLIRAGCPAANPPTANPAPVCCPKHAMANNAHIPRIFCINFLAPPTLNPAAEKSTRPSA